MRSNCEMRSSGAALVLPVEVLERVLPREVAVQPELVGEHGVDEDHPRHVVGVCLQVGRGHQSPERARPQDVRRLLAAGLQDRVHVAHHIPGRLDRVHGLAGAHVASVVEAHPEVVDQPVAHSSGMDVGDGGIVDPAVHEDHGRGSVACAGHVQLVSADVVQAGRVGIGAARRRGLGSGRGPTS